MFGAACQKTVADAQKTLNLGGLLRWGRAAAAGFGCRAAPGQGALLGAMDGLMRDQAMVGQIGG